ncbi:hypothetical protein M2339_001029 [Sphingobium sp. B2D3C]|nr:hypothetical protein [Sphingobium sp. B2D3C]
MAGEHVRIRLGATSLRLDVVSGTMLSGAVTIDPLVQLGSALGEQIKAVRRLDALLHDAVVPEVNEVHIERLVLALRVADARREGASLREIARGLFGDCDWPGEGEWVKSRVRRLVARAGLLKQTGPMGVFRY